MQRSQSHENTKTRKLFFSYRAPAGCRRLTTISRASLLLLRFDDQFNTLVERQILRRRCPDVCRRKCPIAVQVIVEEIRLAGGGEVRIHLIGLSAKSTDALEAVEE